MSSAMNLGRLLTHSARLHPQRPAIIHGDCSVSWCELDRRVVALASGLQELGVHSGSAVLVQCRNSIAMIEAMWAIMRAGGVLVPVNFRAAPQELAYMAARSDTTLIVHDEEFTASAQYLLQDDGPVTRAISTAANSVIGTTLDMLAHAHADDADSTQEVSYDDPVWHFFTSGTTGRPKAAILTHGQMAFVVNNHLADLLPDLTAQDLSLAIAPLSHGAGIHLLVNSARAAGTVLMKGGSFEAEDALRLIQKHRIANLFAVPTLVKTLAESQANARCDCSSLRQIVYAGAPMYRADQCHALQTFGSVLVQYYGLGEVTGNITVLPAAQHNVDDARMPVGSCGFARTGMEVRIVDPHSDEPLACGESGEICAKGPAVFRGYLNDPEATAKAIRNGWFHTGDIGHMDARGFVYITGRLSDMFISGGSNIYPREIEEQLLLHTAVREAVVVGIPDAHWGEIGVALIVWQDEAPPQPELITTHLRTRLASYKIPKRIEFWAEIPKTAYGKVSKQQLRDMIVAPARSAAGGI